MQFQWFATALYALVMAGFLISMLKPLTRQQRELSSRNRVFFNTSLIAVLFMFQLDVYGLAPSAQVVSVGLKLGAIAATGFLVWAVSSERPPVLTIAAFGATIILAALFSLFSFGLL